MMKMSTICKGCWCQKHMLMPIHGPLSVPFKLVGVRPSRMNPNICNMCETNFRKVRKAKRIVVPAAILFADVRGYTGLSELLESQRVSQLLTLWYDQCAPAIWQRDGIVNKLMGDAILAVFNFPITRGDYVRQAVLSGIELQKNCQEVRASLAKEGTEKDIPFGIGVGISAGQVSIGEVGEVCKDFTVVGTVVNLASRLQGAASAGEILVTQEVYQQMGDVAPCSVDARTAKLKGIEEPVKAYALKV